MPECPCHVHEAHTWVSSLAQEASRPQPLLCEVGCVGFHQGPARSCPNAASRLSPRPWGSSRVSEHFLKFQRFHLGGGVHPPKHVPDDSDFSRPDLSAELASFACCFFLSPFLASGRNCFNLFLTPCGFLSAFTHSTSRAPTQAPPHPAPQGVRITGTLERRPHKGQLGLCCHFVFKCLFTSVGAGPRARHEMP